MSFGWSDPSRTSPSNANRAKATSMNNSPRVDDDGDPLMASSKSVDSAGAHSQADSETARESRKSPTARKASYGGIFGSGSQTSNDPSKKSRGSFFGFGRKSKRAASPGNDSPTRDDASEGESSNGSPNGRTNSGNLIVVAPRHHHASYELSTQTSRASSPDH